MRWNPLGWRFNAAAADLSGASASRSPIAAATLLLVSVACSPSHPAEREIQALVDTLASSEMQVRVMAMDALVEHRERAIAPLIDALASPIEVQRLSAAQALTSLGDAAVPSLLGRLSAGSEVERDVAAYALSRMGGPAAAPLGNWLNENDGPAPIQYAFRALAAIGPEASAAVPAVTAKLRSEHRLIRLHALMVLAAIDDAHPAVIADLSTLIASDDDLEVRTMGCRLLGHFGPRAAAAAPALEVVAALGAAELSGAANEALRAMGR